MTGVPAHLLPQLGHPFDRLGVGGRSSYPRCAQVELGQLGPERGRKTPPRRRLLRIEPLPDPHPTGDHRRAREVGKGQPAYLPVLGQHHRPRRLGVRPGPRVDDHHPALAATAGHPHNVPGAQRLHDLQRLGPPVRAAFPSRLRLDLGDLGPQPGVPDEVAPVARRIRPGRLDLLGVASQGPCHADHRTVRLELGERLLQQDSRPLPAYAADQVDRHVVGRHERRTQRIGTPRRQAGDRARVQPRLPEHHRVALDVDPAPPGPPGQLGVLPRRDVGVALTVELDQFLQDHRPGRHVDAQRERLSREHHLDQPADERLLDAFLERRQQTGVVRGDPAEHRLGEPVVLQCSQIAVGQPGRVPVEDVVDLGPLASAGQPQSGGQQLPHRRVTTGPGEDEHDGRQQVGAVEQLDDVRPVRAVERPRPTPRVLRRAGRSATCTAVRPAAVAHVPPAPSAGPTRPAGVVPNEP